MSTKQNPGSFSERNIRADEPYFVLAGRDPLTAWMIQLWGHLRAGQVSAAADIFEKMAVVAARVNVVNPLFGDTHTKVNEAFECANDCNRYYQQTRQTELDTEAKTRITDAMVQRGWQIMRDYGAHSRQMGEFLKDNDTTALDEFRKLQKEATEKMIAKYTADGFDVITDPITGAIVEVTAKKPPRHDPSAPARATGLEISGGQNFKSSVEIKR